MKRLIYTTAVDTTDRAVKDTHIIKYTKNSWKSYAQSCDADFYIIDKELDSNTSPHWFRYWIFEEKPDYEQYLYVDADVMAKWDAPNIFEAYKDPYKLYAVQDNSGLSWIWESLIIYQTMFRGVNVPWDEYFNSGVLLFSKEHRPLIEGFKDFYLNNKEEIARRRDKFRKGFDQTLFNYFCRFQEIDIELIPDRWNLLHMIRKEVYHNAYFADMAYFWHFNGFPRETQVQELNKLATHFEPHYTKMIKKL